MATEKQIEANRRNAKKSTGPRSAEGKAASSRNTLKSGLYAREVTLVKENPIELERLEQQFSLEYCPVTPTERALVDALAHLERMIRRYRKIETKVWDHVKDRMSSEAYVENYLGNAFIEEPAIQRVTRMRNSAQRQFRETVTQLRALQAERKASQEPLPEFPPVREYDDTPKIIPQISDEEAESIIYARFGLVPSKDGKRLEPPPPPAVPDAE